MKKTLNKLPELSIFFPAFNEAGNIQETLKQALLVAPQVAQKYEIIVVNDGSKDATLQIAKRMTTKYKYIRVVNQRNKGYGGAIKRGFKEAKYDWIFFTDSDLQFDLNELKKFISSTQNADLVLGFRLNRAEGWKRKNLARCLKLWNCLLLGFPTQIKDTDCAFKLIHQNVLHETEPLISNGALLSTEFLLKAHRAGFEYTQIGVTHYQRAAGQPTGSDLKVIFQAVKDTFRLQAKLSMHTLKNRRKNFAFLFPISYTN